MPGDHFYCTDFRGETASQAGYEREGITGFLYPTPAAGTTALYRWFHPGSGDHFYCTDPNGELAPQAGYVAEGITGYLFLTQVPGTVALYRWFHPVSGDHFYCTDPNGELAPQAGYTAEGVTGFLYLTEHSGTAALYRWFQSGIMTNFTFDQAITPAQRATLLERHSWAYFRGRHDTTNLTAQERADLAVAYAKPIAHGVNNDPNANASSIVGGAQIWVNFTNLFPLGDNEISQTLIHEIMHSAGYRHPVRIDPPAPNADRPGDNGPYYGSPPLRAELCIAGVQSDKGRITLFNIAQGHLRVAGIRAAADLPSLVARLPAAP